MSIKIANDVKDQGGNPSMVQGTFAQRPSAGQTGRLYLSTDTNVIYRDNGTTWDVFLSQVSTTGFVTLATTQTITGDKTFNAGTTFNNTVNLNLVPVLNIGNSLFNTSTPQINLYDFSSTKSMQISLTATVGTLTFVNQSSLQIFTLGNTGDVGVVGRLSIGPAPGVTYKLEVDGGINVATTHDYRKVGVSIFNTTNNNIPKFSTTTNTYTNSNILDTGTVISLNSTTLVNTTTDNGSGAKLQVIGNISFQNVFNRKTASYTLVLADQNDIIEMNVATANNLTVPLNSTVAFPIGTEIAISQYGAGKTTIVATGGVTIRSVGGLLSLSAQYAWATLVKVGTDEWYAVGSLIA